MNEIHEIKKDIHQIIEDYDVLELDLDDAVYEKGEVWRIASVSLSHTDTLEYRLQNRNRKVDREIKFYSAQIIPEAVECPWCDSTCTYANNGDDVYCKNDGCAMTQFDAKKYLDEESDKE
jgi:hypothetical protein